MKSGPGQLEPQNNKSSITIQLKFNEIRPGQLEPQIGIFQSEFNWNSMKSVPGQVEPQYYLARWFTCVGNITWLGNLPGDVILPG